MISLKVWPPVWKNGSVNSQRQIHQQISCFRTRGANLLLGRCPCIWRCFRGRAPSGCRSHVRGWCSAPPDSRASGTSLPPTPPSCPLEGRTGTAPPFQSVPAEQQQCLNNDDFYFSYLWSARAKEKAWVVKDRTSPRSRAFLRNLFSNTVGSTSAVGLGLMDGSKECKHVGIHLFYSHMNVLS